MRESVVEREVRKFAEGRGWLVRKMAYIGRHGCPDRFFFGPEGRLLIVEFKAPSKDPETHQAKEHVRLRDRGFTVHVIDDIATGCRLFL